MNKLRVGLVLAWTVWGGIVLAGTPIPDSNVRKTSAPAGVPAPLVEDETLPPTFEIPVLPASSTGQLVSLSPGPQMAPPQQVWASAEYLLWWIKDGNLPPLATVGPVAGQGILGAAGTMAVLNGSDLSSNPYSGARFRAGLWLDPAQKCGLEVGYFFLCPQTEHFTPDCPPGQVLGRPFFNTTSGLRDAQLVCLPGVAQGGFRASEETCLQGGEINAASRCLRTSCLSLDLLGGFRILSLQDDLNIDESVRVAPAVPLLGGRSFQVSDEFNARTRFYGGQVGVRGQYQYNRLWVNVQGKIALGSSDESVQIQGSTQTTYPNGTRTTIPAGLLALATNSGHFDRQAFAVVPEVGVNFGFQLTKGLSAFLGYNFLYWSNVVRPGDQIDLALNENRIPSSLNFGRPGGSSRPAFSFKDSDFWAQGINVGLQFQY